MDITQNFTTSTTHGAPPGCVFDLTWTHVSGRLECVGATLRTFPTQQEVARAHPEEQLPEPQPVTALLWRTARLGEAIEATRRTHERIVAQLTSDDSESGSVYVERAQNLAEARGGRTGRKPDRGPDDFRRVAEVYSAAYRRHENPNEAVQAAFTIGRSGASKLIRRARDHGFLGETSRGKAGGIRPDEEENK